MANFTASSKFNYHRIPTTTFFAEVEVRTSTKLVYVDATTDLVESYSGTRLSDAEGYPSAGTWNSLTVTRYDDTPYYEITGLSVNLSSTIYVNSEGDSIDYSWLYDYGYTVDNVSLAFGTAQVAYLLKGNDVISGSSFNDVLAGFAGNDAINGNAGDDLLEGWSGNDTLTGGVGSDNLSGGSGADTFVLNAIVGTNSDSGRVVVSGINNDKGQDTLTSFSLTEDTIKVVATKVTSFVHGIDTTIGAGTGAEVAGDRVSFSTSTGLIELNQTTNNNWADIGDIAVNFATPKTTLTEANFESRLQYSLTGTTAANTLTGGALSDMLRGGYGNDSLTGSSGNDTLYGDAGNDLLRGGAGNDILYGGTGQDLFRFDTTLSSTSNVDQIKDFSVADDSTQLENSIFTKFGTTTSGVINAAYFKANTTGIAADSDDYIVYETDTGKLFYDADGSGAGASIQIALIGSNLALTNADFVLV